jgi:hypothetical protein
MVRKRAKRTLLDVYILLRYGGMRGLDAPPLTREALHEPNIMLYITAEIAA